MDEIVNITAFQLVQNKGFDEALETIRTKIDFLLEDNDLSNLKNIIERDIEYLKVKISDLNTYNNVERNFYFLYCVEQEIIKMKENIN